MRFKTGLLGELSDPCAARIPHFTERLRRYVTNYDLNLRMEGVVQ
jgi:hypothetical protein